MKLTLKVDGVEKDFEEVVPAVTETPAAPAVDATETTPDDHGVQAPAPEPVE